MAWAIVCRPFGTKPLDAASTSRVRCVLFVLLLLAGCSSSAPPQFRLNTEGRDPAKIARAQRETIVAALEKLFGTPDEPRIPEKTGLDLELLDTAAGPVGSDETRYWGLYRKHCVACHGISGDGAGPNAAMLNPYPRDFRNGTFKYTSTAGGAKPVRSDLERTIRRGVPGTAMPSFDRLSDEHLRALLEYVKYLSLRGETELYLLQQVIDQDEYPIDLKDVQADGVAPVVALWEKAREMVVEPPPRPPLDTSEQRTESLERGRALYLSVNAKCAQCHGPKGRGDGEQAAELFDDWNRPKKGVTAEQTADRARLFLLSIQRLRPRNFTEGVFRGGDRPIDVYWRVHVGIKGTPMPPAGPAPGSSGVLAPEQIWSVVEYVRSLGE